VISSHGTSVLVHATDDVARSLEELQFTVGEGPSVDAVRHAHPVLVADLADESDALGDRWPAFLAEVRRIEAQALFAFPIRVGDVALGTLGLYRRTPGDLEPDQVAVGLTAVDALGSSLLAPEPPHDGVDSYPLTVHRAAGMVMVQLDSSIEVALVRLRATAYLEGMLITALALEVLEGRRRFGTEDT
jgi:hypothetical protein